MARRAAHAATDSFRIRREVQRQVNSVGPDDLHSSSRTQVPARKFPGSLMVARRNRGWVARKFSACQIGGGWHASSARKFSACQIGGGWHASSAHASSARKFICCLIPQRRLFFRGHLLRVALSNVFVRTTFTEKFGIYQSKRDCDSTCSHCC